MFGLFQANPEKRKKKLEAQYSKLLDEAHTLSHQNRKKSDLKAAEADQVLQSIKLLESQLESKR